MAGENDEILLELWYNDRIEPDDPEEGMYDTRLLQCVRSNLEQVIYHNHTDEPLWVRNGAEQQSSPRIDPGMSLLHPFHPDPPLPPWQVPFDPKQAQWQEESAAQLNPYLPSDVTIARQGGQTCDSAFRRPTVWMRGRTITPEQALEVIRRCDSFFRSDFNFGQALQPSADTVSVQLLESDLFRSGNGWCLPNGRIGNDDICHIKNPFEEEILQDGIFLTEQFPFLDVFFLFWACEENELFTPGQLLMHGMPQPEFGVRFRHKRVEIYNPHSAWQTFCHFQKNWGQAPHTYDRFYLMRQGTDAVDRNYLDRCLLANGQPPASCVWQPKPPNNDLTIDKILRLRYEILCRDCGI